MSGEDVFLIRTVIGLLFLGVIAIIIHKKKKND